MADDFRVIALIAARNERDIIVQVVRDLIEQGIEVYLIDDGSSDGTASAVAQWLGKGLLEIEHRPDTAVFQWTELLKRKERLAIELGPHWFIHHDADEFRESPWPGLNLREAVNRVSELGYNAIDFKVLNFRPTHDAFQAGDDVRTAFPFYERAEHWDSLQVKCWRQGREAVDLVSSGGHEVQFGGRQICPVQFLVRHYPIRGQGHGVQKVFVD